MPRNAKLTKLRVEKTSFNSSSSLVTGDASVGKLLNSEYWFLSLNGKITLPTSVYIRGLSWKTNMLTGRKNSENYTKVGSLMVHLIQLIPTYHWRISSISMLMGIQCTCHELSRWNQCWEALVVMSGPSLGRRDSISVTFSNHRSPPT